MIGRVTLFAATALFSSAVAVADPSPRIITVGHESGATSISQAVHVAQPGDTIMVPAGTYREPTIELSRSVAVIGQPGAVLDGEGERVLMLVTGENVTIEGLHFGNVGVSFVEDRAAVKVDGAHD
ncbi:MAG: hypothetical protein R3282_02865, partial [Rhodothermales bacterium]|nr:hypothetical protein [Rhodothermales bacterium]